VLFAAAGIGTTAFFFASRLDRGAGNRAIGTEYAAVSLQRPEQFAAPLAFVVPLARIGWHDLGLPMATFWTGDRGSKFDIVIHHSSSLVPSLQYSWIGKGNYRLSWLRQRAQHAVAVQQGAFDQSSCTDKRETHQMLVYESGFRSYQAANPHIFEWGVRSGVNGDSQYVERKTGSKLQKGVRHCFIEAGFS
jgi:hypothetical protein